MSNSGFVVHGKGPRQNIPARHGYILPEPPQPFAWNLGCKGPWSIIGSLERDTVNQISNPSFETNILGWENAGTIAGVTVTRVGANAYRGIAGARVSAPAGAGEYGATYAALGAVVSPYNPINATWGQRFYGSIKVKGCVGDIFTLKFEQDGFITGATFTLTNPAEGVAATGGWQDLSTWVEAHLRGGLNPPTGLPVRLQITSNNGSGCNQFFIDAAAVTNTEAQYFDGDTSGVNWNGIPHASTSTASRFTRGLGKKVYFSDIGLELFGDDGHGYPPIENITRSYAQRNGARLQGTRFLPRVITLQFDLGSCSGPEDMHRMRKSLIDALSFSYNGQCPQELALSYQLFDNCCVPTTSELRIPVSLEGGLGGLRTSPYSERIALQFVANTDVLWSTPNQSSVPIFRDGAPTRLTTAGDADAYPVIRISAGTAGYQISRIINDVVESAITLGVPNSPYTVPAGQTLAIDTDPITFSMTLEPSGTSVMSQLNYPASNLETFRLIPGFNSIRLERPPGAPISATAAVSFLWQDKYLSTDGVTVYRTCGGGC